MKKSQHDHISSIDEFEDLTLFANESFDTQDVDLFEFTSEESSPLTRLKSIILSLDWEINDDILQELDDELDNLQSMWQSDKVAEVYLQGLSKIGNYIRTKGAYAHPNSIKLLLTFFYNFEKIISSEQITGEQITQLLKGDVRKFKILQYQINQSETEPLAAAEIQIKPALAIETSTSTPPEPDASKQLKAAILSLDWEVTDESLRQFNEKIAAFHHNVTDNKPALILIQGLQALGDYIADERAEAHPEAFILLHSFSEALEQIQQTGDQQLDQTTIQNLLVDRINRLNNLKLLITSPSDEITDNHRIDEVFDEMNAPARDELIPAQILPSDAESRIGIASPAEELDFEQPLGVVATDESTDSFEAEIDSLFAMDSLPAMESADVQYPDEVLPPDAIQPVVDELADDFIESHLSSKRGLMPALSDADETAGFDENAEPFDLPTQSDLAEQLDFLFTESEAEVESAITFSALDSSELEMVIDEGDEPVAALADLDQEEVDQDDVEIALSGAEEPAFQRELEIETETDPNSLEIQNKLDSFFDLDEEPVETVSTPQAAVEEIEQSIFFNEEDRVQSALADSEEERGFSEEAEVATLSFTPMDEIEEKLDFFFGTDTDEEPVAEEPLHETSPLDSLEESLELTFGESETTEPDIAPALAGFASEEPVTEEEITIATGNQEPDEELAGALDLLFTEPDGEKTETTIPTAVDELTLALEATIDEGQEKPLEESRQIQLAALGALLPMVVRTPSRETIAESATMVAALKQARLSTAQQSLVQLLESVITMLVRLPTKNDAATEKLVNYLYEQLIAEHGQPEVLPEAIGRFTAWLQQASAIMPVVPAASDQEHEPRFAYTAKELYFELSALRAHIREEFDTLRHEMHHHKS
jgi:pilus assembly protein FimV